MLLITPLELIAVSPLKSCVVQRPALKARHPVSVLLLYHPFLTPLRQPLALGMNCK